MPELRHILRTSIGFLSSMQQITKSSPGYQTHSRENTGLEIINHSTTETVHIYPVLEDVLLKNLTKRLTEISGNERTENRSGIVLP